MAIIEFKLPTKIKFGVDSIECLHDTIKQYGGRVVIVTDGNSFNQIGVIDKIVSKLEDNRFTLKLIQTPTAMNQIL